MEILRDEKNLKWLDSLTMNIELVNNCRLKHFKSKFDRILELREENFTKVVHRIKSKIREPIFGYPTEILVEPTNMCYLKCPLCSAPQKYITRKRLAMTFEEFKMIIDDVKNYTHRIYLKVFYTPASLSRLLQSIGFQLIEITSDGKIPFAGKERILSFLPFKWLGSHLCLVAQKIY